MLNGIDPIIIFQLYKLVPQAQATLATIPLTSSAKNKDDVCDHSIYLSEKLTGIYIDTESKNIDIDTDQKSLNNGEPGPVNQNALGSITQVNLVAKRGSVGLSILLALTELILDKVASQEYEITYINGGITVFCGLVHGFSYEQGTNDDLYKIRLELARGRPKTKSVQVAEDPGALRLGSTGPPPPPAAPTTGGGGGGSQSAISPGGGLRLN
jgi:hypothetical protein